MQLRDEFDYLLNQVNIGIYNKCEVIEIFGVDKKKEKRYLISIL
jgi:hypothetical protein